jgi:diamine N-acetyltransferase
MQQSRFALNEDIPFITNGIKEICLIEKQKPENDSKILKSLKIALLKKEILILCENNELIGFVQFKITNQTPYGIDYGKCEKKFCWIDWFYVAKKYRNQGFGKILHQNIRSLCKKKKVNEIMLDVFKINSNARKFYQKEGFSEFIYIMREKIN